MYIKATPIVCSSGYFEESITNDIIFSTNYSNNITANSNDWRDNDYELQFFNTMEDIKMVTVHRTNMITGMRRRPSLANFGFTNGFAKEKRFSADGVYVIENYTVFTENAASFAEIREYIYSIDNSIELSDNDKHAMRGLFNKPTSNCSAGYRFRIVYYIPEETIKKNNTLYLYDLDTVISTVAPNKDLIHPNSKKARKMNSNNRVNEYAEPNLLSIDITNLDSPNKSYFIKIGSKVQKITSSVNDTAHEGYSYVVKNHNSIVEHMTGSLADLPSVGIYETYDQAEFDGNSELKLKNEKLISDVSKTKLDKEKMEQEYELNLLKLKLEKEQLANDKIKLDRDRDRLELELDSLRHKLDTELIKSANDIESMRMRYEHEKETLRIKLKIQYLDYDKKILDNEIVITKFEIDVHMDKLKNQFDKNLAVFKHELDVEKNQAKHKHDRDKTNIDIISKVINGALLIVKNYI